MRPIGVRARWSWGAVIRRSGTMLAGVFIAVGPADAAQLVLEWVDESGGIATFKIERRTETAGTYVQIATAAAGVTGFVDTTVVGSTTFCYRVRASSAGMDSAYSNEACGSAASTSLVVTVVKSGAGFGTVLSSPAGIDCGANCVGSVGANQTVTLTATPASGSIFNGWSGGCTGTDPCTITGNTSVSVTATFLPGGLPDDI